ncbi:MAG: hypothetical protein Q4G34_01075 [Micrococcus sp.]|nr:hypothetical protein [Micrococcus sp.]
MDANEEDLTEIALILTFHGEFAHGSSNPAGIVEVAQEWVDEGFTAEEVAAWLGDADLAWPVTAAAFRDAGITPAQAGQEVGVDIGHGEYVRTLAYKVGNGDLELNEALVIIRALAKDEK